MDNKDNNIFLNTLLQEIAEKTARIARLTADNYELGMKIQELQEQNKDLPSNHSQADNE